MNEIFILGDKTQYIRGEWKEREAARVVLFDEAGRIALMHASNDGYYKLPGGGIDPGESPEIALERELLEECGAKAYSVELFGVTDEYRSEDPLHQISHCFTADLDGIYQIPALTDKEIKAGMKVHWAENLSDAIRLVSNPISDDELINFITTRDTAILKAARLRQE